MELRDFVKGVISEIVLAIDEAQQELGDKACISPVMLAGAYATNVRAGKGCVPVSNIDFDVAVTTGTTESSSAGVGGGIKIFEVFKAGAETSDTSKVISQNVSRVKFQIPIVYPPAEPKFAVKESPRPQKRSQIIRS